MGITAARYHTVHAILQNASFDPFATGSDFTDLSPCREGNDAVCRNILILLVLDVDLFRESARLRLARRPIDPQFRPEATHANLSVRMAYGISCAQIPGKTREAGFKRLVARAVESGARNFLLFNVAKTTVYVTLFLAHNGIANTAA